MKGITREKWAENKIMRLTVLSLAVASIFSAPAFAINDNEGSPLPRDSVPGQASETTLDSMTVSATRSVDVRTKTELGKLTAATPMAGTVVTRESIENVQYVDALRELTGRVPGLSMVRNMRIPDGGKNYTDMRVDGMRVAYSQKWELMDQVNITNVDHIDFINGPGSALNSSYAVGGTINVITRDPPKSFLAKISQETGSFGFLRTQANAGNMLDNGVGYTFSACKSDYAGSRGNSSDKQNKDGIGGEVLFRPSDNTRLIIGLDALNWSYRLAGFLPQALFIADWQQGLPGNYGRTDYNFTTGIARYQWVFGDRAELNLAASKRTTKTDGFGSGGSGGAWQTVCDDGVTAANGTPAAGKSVVCKTVNAGTAAVTNTIVESKETDNAYQALFRKEFDLAKSTFYAGVELTDASVDSVTYNNSFNALQGQSGYWAPGSVNSAGSLSTEKDKTPFVQYEFSPVDKMRFQLGERFDHIDYSINNRAAPAQGGDKSFSKNVFKSGFTYDYAPDQFIWLNYSQGFLAPSVSTLAGSTTTVPNMNLLPEYQLTQEIGLRGSSKTRGLSWDLALYNSTIKDIIVSRDTTTSEKTLYGSSFTTLNENAGSLKARGLETRLAWSASKSLELASTYTWAEAYYDRYISGTGSARTDLSGHDYQSMPRNHLNLRATYFPLPGARVELERDYLSEYFLSTANTSTYHRPTLYNLRTSYAVNKNWNAWLHVLNLTNVKYADRVSIATVNGVSQVAYGTLGNSASYEPLNLRIGIAYKF